MHVVEPMREGDIPDVLAITTAAAERGEQDAQLTVQRLHEELARPWTHSWVARDAGRAVGFLLSWHVADELHVLDVVTHVEHRRRGIGRALMDAAIAFAREARCAHVLLEVRRSNPAIHLYRACGFFALSIRSKYYPDDEDAVEMMLQLDPSTWQIVARKDEVPL